MYVQQKENVFDLDWNGAGVTYGDVFLRNEQEFSAYGFDHANTDAMRTQFAEAEDACGLLLGKQLALPAYDQCIKASHLFNLLDARGVISVTERAAMIGRIRALAKGCCEAWLGEEKAEA
jgi:glycyl-tRNA synthetase alpha chain